MTSNEIKFDALQKKIKGDLKTLITYQYDEVVSLGGYVKLLDEIKKCAEDISKIEDQIKQEAQRALEADERMEQNERLKMVNLKRKKKIIEN